MNDKSICICGECRHYQPDRNPATNRPLPTQPGFCTYPVVWPVLPKAFLPDNLGWGRRVIAYPPRRNMRKGDKESCACFEPLPKVTAKRRVPIHLDVVGDVPRTDAMEAEA